MEWWPSHGLVRAATQDCRVGHRDRGSFCVGVELRHRVDSPSADFLLRSQREPQGDACSDGGRAPAEQVDCGAYRPGADFRSVSERIGQKSCAHPEAKDSRALFCRYPPRFYGHTGVCKQYSQFCPPEELLSEVDAARIETAVINVDAALFHALHSCNVFKEELWIFKVYVHWCPHCQQLMPKLYRLALRLHQQGVVRIRIGAVNCATEHELCGEQGWLGHPLLVPKYQGTDRRIHDAIEHWVDSVKDPQLRQMLPRNAFPGEYMLLKVLFEQLPKDYLPRDTWAGLFADESEGGAEPSQCPNITAMHPSLPRNVDDAVGNGWSDAEGNFTVHQRRADALLMLRHVLAEWIVPLSEDGGIAAFSYQQVAAVEGWVGLLASNLPRAFGLWESLLELRRALRMRLRTATQGQRSEGAADAPGDGGSSEGTARDRAGRLCGSDWKDLIAPVLADIDAVGRRDFGEVPSACASDTCRLWSLLHILSAEGHRRMHPDALAADKAAEHSGPDQARAVAPAPAADRRALPQPPPAEPSAMLDAVRDFLAEYFKCLYCRNHFLKQFDSGAYDLAAARRSSAEALLYLWRLHNAVSVRITAWHRCESVDRRWPPMSLCPTCWDLFAEDWDVLSESVAILRSREAGAGAPSAERAGRALGLRSDGPALRALQLGALPRRREVLAFLLGSFTEGPCVGA